MKAFYFPDESTKVKLDVLLENRDGTVDLGHAAVGNSAAVLIVGQCPLSDNPTVGHAQLIKEAKPAPEEKGNKK